MTRWFQDRRQEFIEATFRQFGQLSRVDIVRQFGVSLPQASADIESYLSSGLASGRIIYDVSARKYVLDHLPANAPAPSSSDRGTV